MLYPDLAAWLEARMAAYGLVHGGDLARLAGVPEWTASRWLKGNHRPSREDCARLAEAFEVPAEEILKAAGYAD
jgi:transcriptional regulator with XRE-family HTH domain